MARTGSYVAAWMDYSRQKVIVIERDFKTHERYALEFDPPYYYYVPDEEGEHLALSREHVPLKKLTFDSKAEFQASFSKNRIRYESDISPLLRVLMDNYYEADVTPPPVRFGLVDIEVDYEQAKGFSSPTDPYAPINAVTIYQSWTKKYITIAVPPPAFRHYLDDRSEFDAATAAGAVEHKFGFTPEIILVPDEKELLLLLIDSIQETDIVSGWNSEFYDIPYIVERIKLVLGEQAVLALELPGAWYPKKEMVNRFGNPEPIYKFSGRAYLDYLKLFQKFTFEGRTSYSLGNIAMDELDIPKLDYEGTLEQLYKQSFVLFVLYNMRDVEVLVKLDEKFNFIALANQMAHENTVLFADVLGTVKYVETGITNHAHNVMNKIVHDKNIVDHDKVEGAIVLTPKIGLHEMVASVDLKSLYPNTIRTINGSPEMIIGQFQQTQNEHDWEIVSTANPTATATLFYDSGEQETRTGAEWNALFKERGWCISAYGTVFDQSIGRGVVADLLGYWYDERKRLQKELKKWTAEVKRLRKEGTKTDLPDGVYDTNTVSEGFIYNAEQWAAIVAAEFQEARYDLLQLTKKIAMNSLYGALLNVAFRFGDPRLGASVTATGRRITKHMIETVGETLSGEVAEVIKRYVADTGVSGQGDSYVKMKKGWNPYASDEAWNSFLNMSKNKVVSTDMALFCCRNESIIYSDTDSCYFRTGATTREDAIEIADSVEEILNASFKPFVRQAFLCVDGFDGFIGASREIVGTRGLWQAKKKYLIKVFNQDGFDVNKIKSQGSEIKKSDTPKIIQTFLKTTIDMILEGKKYDDVATFVNDQRRIVVKDPKNTFLLGVSKQCNNLEEGYADYLQYEVTNVRKVTLPGHVRAAINYNECLKMFEPGGKAIKSGDKILIFYLNPNEYNLKSIAMPGEYSRFPSWFAEHFSVDIKLTEQKMFDNKLGGVFTAIGEVVPTLQSVHVRRIMRF